MSTDLQAQDAFVKWLRGLDSEIAFWNTLYATGHPGHESCNPKVRAGGEFRYAHLLSELEGDCSRIKVLDVGSGPVTCVGSQAPAPFEIELVACDPLAPVYNEILDSRGIERSVRTSFALGEHLLHFFAKNSFHIVHMCNALDHCIDPLAVLASMCSVCRPGGIVLLVHSENEAEAQRYEGLHQWNISASGDDLYFWNRFNRINVTELLHGTAKVRCERSHHSDGRAVITAVIHKVSDDGLKLADAAVRWEGLFELMYYMSSAEYRSLVRHRPLFSSLRTALRFSSFRDIYKVYGRKAKRQLLLWFRPSSKT